MKFTTWTNYLLLIPIVLSIIFELYVMAAIIAGSMTMSIIHHISNKKFLSEDFFFAMILMGANIVLIFLFNFAFPYFHLALLLGVLAFYFFFEAERKSYELNHSLWHIFSVLVTITCILGYGFSSFNFLQ